MKTRKILSILLVTALMLTLLPITAQTAYAAAAPKVKITWNANGGKIGSAKTKAVSYTKGKKIGKLPATPKYTGYTFKGWYTKKSGGTKIKTTTKAKKATYYAQWTAKKYTLTFNANGGSVTPASRKVAYKKGYGALPTPKRDGYTFNGWYTAKSGGTKVTDKTKMAAKNVIVYAQWKKDANSNIDAKLVGHWERTAYYSNPIRYDYYHWYIYENGTFNLFLVSSAEYSYKGNYSVSNGKIYFTNVVFTNEGYAPGYKRNEPDSYVDYVFGSDSKGNERLEISNTGSSFTGSTWWTRSK